MAIMVYTVSDVREVHVYAWLDMYPGTVIVYIIIVLVGAHGSKFWR